MPNSIIKQPDGGFASPVVVSTDEPTGGVAIPVYLYDGYPTDRGITGTLPRPVIEITDADLIGNGGNYSLAGNQFAVPMFIAPSEIVTQLGATPIAIYVVGNSPGGCTGVAPTFVSAEVGDVNDTTVVVIFSEEVSASNFATGVTIKKNTVSQTINSATLQPDNLTVYYVLNAAAAFGDTVTWEYDAAVGNIVEATCETEPLANVSAQNITNNIPLPPWWEAGGATGALVAYQPKGAANLAASYVNLANPGTYDAQLGVAPSLVSGGWSFNGTTQNLLINIAPPNDQTWSALVQFTNASGNTCFAIGAFSSGTDFFALRPRVGAGTLRSYSSGGSLNISGAQSAANMGFAGNKGYLNGSVESGTIGAPAGAGLAKVAIAGNWGGASVSLFGTLTIAALVIYNNTLSGVQMAAVAAAMAAL